MNLNIHFHHCLRYYLGFVLLIFPIDFRHGLMYSGLTLDSKWAKNSPSSTYQMLGLRILQQFFVSLVLP